MILAAALSLLAFADPIPPPPACATVAEALASPAGAVALVTGSRDDLLTLERERLLLARPEYAAAARRVAWFRSLTYWGEGKEFGIASEPTLLRLGPPEKKGEGEKPFAVLETASLRGDPDGKIVGLLRRAAGLPDAALEGESTLGAAGALDRGLRSAIAGGKEREFADAHPGTLHGAVAAARSAETPAPPLPRARSLDALVVVPDVATFLEWIGAWDGETMFPVLIEDAHFVPLFARAFRPAAVFYPKARAPVTLSPEAFDAALRASFGPEAFEPNPAKRRPAALPKPVESAAGLVVVDPSSPEAAGGLALAAGRGQRLAFVPAPPGGPARAASPGEFAEMQRRVEAAAEATGLPWHGLGSGIDFVTLAGAYPLGVLVPGAEEKGPYALDDAIARGDFELPWAFTGRLVGDAPRAVWQAMASLFLEGPSESLLFSRYDTASEPWKSYDTDLARAMLEPLGAVRQSRGEEATFARWHDTVLTAARSGADLVFVNSSGGTRDWSLAGPVSGLVEDVPLSEPAVVHVTHSGSMGNPYDEDTIAGRWLGNGAFVYFGSTAEPFLDAFNPPDENAARALAGMPLSRAFRRMPPDSRWRPWKLAYAGDPLRTLRPEAIARVPARADLARPASVALAALASPKTAAERARRATILELLGRRKEALDTLEKAARGALGSSSSSKKKPNEDGREIARAVLGIAAAPDDAAAVRRVAVAALKSGVADEALGCAVWQVLRSEAARRAVSGEGEAALEILRDALALPQRETVARDAVTRYVVLAKRCGADVASALRALARAAGEGSAVARIAGEAAK